MFEKIKLKKMHLRIGIGVILAIVILGFLIPLTAKETIICTEMYCSCEGITGEIRCNTCHSSTPFFSLLGILNFSMNCPGREIIRCVEGERKATHIEWHGVECGLQVNVLSWQ